MTPPNHTIPQRRYSCHECREDAELVMSDRATSSVSELYHGHIGECRDCRRMHRLLYALYEGPVIPQAPSGVREEKEFHATLRRAREFQPDPWYHKLTIRAGIVTLAGSAAALALALFDVTPKLGDDADTDGAIASVASSGSYDHSRGSLATDDGGIHHPAQSYGRIVGGNATVITDGGDTATTTTFPVGTHFSVDAGDTLQVGMIGKIVANFTPSSEVEWTTASRNLIELKLERGVVAVRYDRRPSDPILQVRTPSAVVRVIGTVFTVQVDAEDNTAVSVLRGQVDVMKPNTNELLAEVESGSVYDVTTASYSDVSKVEVAAALPLSIEADAAATVDGSIPSSWYVPGLPDDKAQRTLAYVPAKVGAADFTVEPVARRSGARGSHADVDEPVITIEPAPAPRARSLADEGEDLIERLVEDAKATHKKELRAQLAKCDSLFHSPTKRYRAAGCLSHFLDKYGEDKAAVKAYLLVGMLRHDYAFDYRAAEKAFETFLRRAPNHPSAEFAHYRMWLSATEDGRISTAEKRGRKYLQRYPNGKHVGKILQRFPQLKDEL
ncbi:MAG: FecR domain-containing protein [Myxococcota bacterium]